MGRRDATQRTDSPYVRFEVEQIEVVRLDQLSRLVPERVDLLSLCGLAREAVEARFERVDPREMSRHLCTTVGISCRTQLGGWRKPEGEEDGTCSVLILSSSTLVRSFSDAWR